MANALFDSAKEAFLGSGPHGAILLATDAIDVIAVDHADDTPSLTADQDLADILAAARVFTHPDVASKTTTDGTFDHADFTTGNVSGDQFESLVWYKDSGTEASSPLIVYVDTATGLPFTPSGGPIQITLSASGLFKI